MPAKFYLHKQSRHCKQGLLSLRQGCLSLRVFMNSLMNTADAVFYG